MIIGKSIGKWEDHSKTIGKPWENDWKMEVYPPVNLCILLWKDPPCSSMFNGKTHELSTGPFSFAMQQITRAYLLHICPFPIIGGLINRGVRTNPLTPSK